MLASPVPGVEALELLRFLLLAVEELHGGHAGDVLLQEGVDGGDAGPHLAIRDPRAAAEPDRHDDDERRDREQHQRQAPVHPEEHADDADQHEDVAEDGDESGREHLVERVDVGGHAGHEPAHGIPVEVLDVEPLQMPEDLFAEVVHDVLPHQIHQHHLRVEHGESGDQRGHVKDRRHLDSVQRLQAPAEGAHGVRHSPAHPDRVRSLKRLHEEVDGHGDDRRPHDLQRRRENDQDHREPGPHPVRPQIAQQPPRQPRIESPRPLFFVSFDFSHSES